RPRQRAPVARGKHLRRGERGGAPGAYAPGAGDELAKRALKALAGLGLVGPLDERLAEKARPALSRQGPGRLEGRRRQRDELQRRARRRAPRQRRNGAETGEKGTDERGQAPPRQ